MGAFHAAFGFFLTWWGAYLLAALDSTVVFFLPFGVDALVIYLSARSGMFFWIYPLLAAAGSVTGAAVTYWVGRKVGEMGLDVALMHRHGVAVDIGETLCQPGDGGAQILGQ